MNTKEILFVVALNNEVGLEGIGFTKATNSMQGDMSRRICEAAVSFPAPLNIYHHTSGTRLLITGIGKVNATYALLDFLCANSGIKMVYNIGTAGGGLGVNAGDLLWCNKFVQYDMNATPQVNEEIGLTPYDDVPRVITFDGDGRADKYYTCATADTFNTSNTQYDVYDMEAYGLAKVCCRKGLQFYAIKYITDVVHLNDAKDDELWKIYLPRAKVALTEKILEIIDAVD